MNICRSPFLSLSTRVRANSCHCHKNPTEINEPPLYSATVKAHYSVKPSAVNGPQTFVKEH
jgi:hypothetical protein